MANQLVNRTINIYIQSGEAQKALDALLKKQTAYKNELTDSTNPKRIAKLKEEIEKLQEPISRAAKKLSGELSPSIKDVQASVNSLGNRMKRMSEEDADFEPVMQQWKAMSSQLEAQREKVGLLSRAMNSFWKEAKTVAVGVVIGNTVQSMLQTVMGYVTGMVTGSAKIADELSDIEKVTTLTTAQVSQLNTELGKIDTRTSRSELREMAVAAGKLGIDGKENILEFVRAVDQLNVALGDDLSGNTEEIIKKIGKLNQVFKVDEAFGVEQGLLKIGSAVNELSASSSASADYLIEFSKRMGGIAPLTNISIQEILGLGATLDQLGQTSEVSSTALSKLFVNMAKDAGSFAKYAGMEVNEFKNLLETDFTAAFIKVLEGVKSSSNGINELAGSLGDLGADGGRVVGVLGTLANNVDTLKKQVDISNASFAEGTSVVNEFQKKNTNAAAELDKLKKNFAGLFQSTTIREGAAFMISTLNGLVTALKNIPVFIKENRSAIALLVTGIVLLNSTYLLAAVATARDSVAKIFNAAVTRGTAVANNIAAAATIAYSIAVQLLTGRITLAAAAQRVWAAAMSLGLGPLGIILTTVGALVIAISSLVGSTQRLTAAQRVQLEVEKQAADQTAETKNKILLLTGVINDNKLSLDARKKALQELIDISPEYLKGLTLENLETAEGKKILDDYNKVLLKNAELKAKSSLLDEQSKVRAKALIDINRQKDALKVNESFFPGLTKEIQSGNPGAATKKFVDYSIGPFRDLVKEFVEANETLNILNDDLVKSEVQKRLEQSKTAEQGAANTAKSIAMLREELKAKQEARDATTDDKVRTKLNQEIKDLENKIRMMEGGLLKISPAANKAAKDLKSLEQELKNLALSLLPEETMIQSFDKELARLDEKYEALRAKAHGNAKLLQEIDRLFFIERDSLYAAQSKKFKDQLEKEEKTHKRILAQREEDFKKLVPLQASVEGAGLRLGNLLGRDQRAKAELDAIKKTGKEKLQAELKFLNDKKNAELAMVGLTENEKELIREKYRKEAKKKELDYWTGLFEEILFWASSMLNVFNLLGAAKTQKENDELARDKANNDKKKQNLEKRLKGGLISQQQYDREIQKIDKAAEAREKEIRLKQFKRDQRAQLAQAVINGGSAVLETLKRFGPPMPPNFAGIAAMALTALTTAATIGKIAGAKPPQYGKGGGFLQGPSHSDKSKGLPVVHPYTGKVQAYLEGGEGIGSKKTMSDKRKYSVEGTPSQIYSLLNGVNGGVSWESGAVLRPAWSTQRPMPMNIAAINSSISKVKGFYASGGKFAEKPGVQTESAGSDSLQMLDAIKQLVNVNMALSQTLSDLQQYGVSAIIPLGQIEDQAARLEAIKREATLKA